MLACEHFGVAFQAGKVIHAHLVLSETSVIVLELLVHPVEAEVESHLHQRVDFDAAHHQPLLLHNLLEPIDGVASQHIFFPVFEERVKHTKEYFDAFIEVHYEDLVDELSKHEGYCEGQILEEEVADHVLKEFLLVDVLRLEVFGEFFKSF